MSTVGRADLEVRPVSLLASFRLGTELELEMEGSVEARVEISMGSNRPMLFGLRTEKGFGCTSLPSASCTGCDLKSWSTSPCLVPLSRVAWPNISRS